MKKLIAIIFSVFALLPISVSAVTISYTDPVGDHTGIVDVTAMDFEFDSSGDYTIALTADILNPFSGDIRININLFNVTQGEYFQDAFNDFSGLPSQTSLSLSGNNLILADWMASDNVVTSTLAGFGNPPGITIFRSSVADLPFDSICQSEDVIGIDGCNPDIPPIPVPAAVWLFGTALVGFIGIARRRRVS